MSKYDNDGLLKNIIEGTHKYSLVYRNGWQIYCCENCNLMGWMRYKGILDLNGKYVSHTISCNEFIMKDIIE